MYPIFRVHTRKIWHNIWYRKRRTLLVALSIFMGVVGVVTLTSTGDLLVGTLQEDLRQDQLTMLDVHLEVEERDLTPADNASALALLRDYPGVTAAEGWNTPRLFWRKPEDSAFIEGRLRVFSESFGELKIEPMKLLEGDFPAAGKHEVAIEQRFAERYALAVGDTLVLRELDDLDQITASDQDIPATPYTITGVVFHPYTGIPDMSIYADFSQLEPLSGRTGYNLFKLRFENPALAERENDNIEALISEQTSYDVHNTSTFDPADNAHINETRQWTDTIFLLALMAMGVACFLVVTVITTMLIEQRRLIGLMKAIGAGRLDLLRIYLGIALAYGVLGTVPGVVLGVPAGYALAQEIAPRFDIWLDDFTVSWSGVALGVALGLGLPLLAATLPVLYGTRIAIVDAIIDRGISARFGNTMISQLVGRLPLPVIFSQAVANVYLKKWRLALTTFSLMLASAAFMGVSSLLIAFDRFLDASEHTFNYAFVILLDEEHDPAEVSRLVKDQIQGVADVHPSYEVYLEPPGQSGDVLVLGLDPTTDMIQFDLVAGDGWQDNPKREGVVLTDSLAEELGAGVGETLEYAQGDSPVEMEVIGIDRFPFKMAFVEWQYLATIDQPLKPPQPNALRVQLKDEGASAATVDRRMAQTRDLLLRHNMQPRFHNQIGTIDELRFQVTTGGIVFSAVSLIMAAIGAIGLLATLSISVVERQREIGIMRSVGASSWHVAAQFLAEGLIIGLLAWLTSLPLSYGINQLLLESLPLDEFEMGFPLLTIVFGLVGIILVSSVASLYPSLLASRRRIADILRYQ